LEYLGLAQAVWNASFSLRETFILPFVERAGDGSATRLDAANAHWALGAIEAAAAAYRKFVSAADPANDPNLKDSAVLRLALAEQSSTRRLLTLALQALAVRRPVADLSPYLLTVS
jgi:hypothetical protein